MVSLERRLFSSSPMGVRLGRKLNNDEFLEETLGMVVTLIAFVALLPGAKQVNLQELEELIGILMPQASSGMDSGSKLAMEALGVAQKYDV